MQYAMSEVILNSGWVLPRVFRVWPGISQTAPAGRRTSCEQPWFASKAWSRTKRRCLEGLASPGSQMTQWYRAYSWGVLNF